MATNPYESPKIEPRSRQSIWNSICRLVSGCLFGLSGFSSIVLLIALFYDRGLRASGWHSDFFSTIAVVTGVAMLVAGLAAAVFQLIANLTTRKCATDRGIQTPNKTSRSAEMVFAFGFVGTGWLLTIALALFALALEGFLYLENPTGLDGVVWAALLLGAVVALASALALGWHSWGHRQAGP